MIGGAGDDRLIGGSGSDQLTGRAGADVFEFAFGEETGFVAEFITDFELEIDAIELAGFGYAAAADLPFISAESGEVCLQLTPKRCVVFEGHFDQSAIDIDANAWMLG